LGFYKPAVNFDNWLNVSYVKCLGGERQEEYMCVKIFEELF